MYKNTRFTIESMEQIERDLQEVKSIYGSLKRIFLINGDAFVLSARRLKAISDKIIEYFPEMEVISMYASIRNIMDKSDEDLKKLKDARINDLWIGLETGSEKALKNMNKGFSIQDSYTQLERLNKVGIHHNGIFIFGAAGKGMGIQNAVDTAKLINTTKPQLVGYTTLGIFPGSELENQVNDGAFTPASELEIIEEEKKVLELIEVDNIPFYGTHPLNAAGIIGILPKDRNGMIAALNDYIERTDKNYLNSTANRSAL